MRSWRWGLIALGVAGYALFSHLLMLHAAAAPWSIAALTAPAWLVLVGVALRQRRWPLMAVCAGLLLGVALVVARGGDVDVNRLYVVQHAGWNITLAWVFGVTLRRGSSALITRLSTLAHGSITPAMAAYTRRLTAVWVGYFVAMVVISLALYAWAPWPVWSLFGNVLTPLSAIALFIGEYLLRYRLHPEFERATMAQAVRAYRQLTHVQGPPR